MKGKIVFVAVTLGAAAGLSRAWEPVISPLSAPPSRSADATQIERGARLAALGDCIVCHTSAHGKPYAGGRPLETPFGAIYATNITPDMQTGIGDWSLDAFRRALRDGVSRDGHLLYPAFPYPHFTRMTDGDIADLYAFMMSRAPVQATAPPNHLVFPLNFRPLVAGWNMLYLKRGPEQGVAVPASAPSAASDPRADAGNAPNAASAYAVQWQLGRYLVNGVAHCAACHTPLNKLGAEKRDAPFAGGTLEGWDAPALTKLSQAPTPWTQAQLVSYLRTGFASQHGAAAGPMRPVTQSLAQAPLEDVDAIATYVMSLQTPTAATPTAAPARPADLEQLAPPAALATGATLFNAACASCHSIAAPMSTQGDRPSLAQGTAVNADSPRNAVRMMLDGIDWHGSDAAHFMPSFAQTFTDAQIADLANYTRARFSARGPWPGLDAAAVARIRKETAKP
ncbi:cytochrome c [Paraburkholderia rhizosphaerae]|uniref:Mono/diheme cytochrome c family protein n=1 Tax=Paraburkholderia rhizosphaerae TaxID=480658 RepID=A0A4R8LPM7_9BURK|nr:cytochrome c [Paraburkholderia rhizosphaerae]TDY46562.1 mono/diheme cytochrome c family protein [Paraburkholderia rhizosphaerae]